MIRKPIITEKSTMASENTTISKGKTKRKDVKKAYVTLEEGNRFMGRPGFEAYCFCE